MPAQNKAKTMTRIARADSAERILLLSDNTLIRAETLRSMLADPGLVDIAVGETLTGLRERNASGPSHPKDQLVDLGLPNTGADHLLNWSHRWGRYAGVSTRFRFLRAAMSI